MRSAAGEGDQRLTNRHAILAGVLNLVHRPIRAAQGIDEIILLLHLIDPHRGTHLRLAVIQLERRQGRIQAVVRGAVHQQTGKREGQQQHKFVPAQTPDHAPGGQVSRRRWLSWISSSSPLR